MVRFFTFFLFILFFFTSSRSAWAQLSLTAFDTDHSINFDATVANVNNGTLVLNNAPATTPVAGQLDADAWSLSPSTFQGQSNGGVSTGGWYAFLVNTGSRGLGAQPTSGFNAHSIVLTVTNNTGATIEEMQISFKLFAGDPQTRNSTIAFSGSSGSGNSGTETTDNILSSGTSTISSWKYITQTLNITGLNITNGSTYTLTISTDRGVSSGSSDEWAVDDIVFRPITTSPITSDIVLSRTETDTLSYIYDSGPSSIDTFRVSGDTLLPGTGYLGLKAPLNFEISTSSGGPFYDTLSLAYTDSTLSATTIYFRLKSGLSPNIYTGGIQVSGGSSTTKNINLYGKVIPGPCSDLIFSEYVEGSGSNKYIEIYNPTSSAVLLNDGSTHFYRLGYYANGSSTAAAINFNSNASIPAYGTYVIGHGSGTIYSSQDQTFGFSFNGDDAISIQKLTGATYNNIDVFGEIGNDPGSNWTVGGISSANTTLVRKPDVTIGSPSASGFPTLGTEWIAYSNDEGHTLGMHASICNTPSITYVDNFSKTDVCPGESITVDFNATGTFSATNNFRAQLSNSSGSFSSFTNIGSIALSGTNVSGTINATIPVSAIASSDYHVRIVTANSNPAAGTEISISHLNVMSSTPNVVTNPSHTQENNATTLSWTNPTSGCWQEVMVVLSTNATFSFTPTGNGSLYTANSVYGSGNQVVYRGSGDNINITGLTNGTIYYVKIFTRYRTNWSGAVDYNFLVDPICYPRYSGSCDEYISRVTLNTINNITGEGCGYNGYSWHANQTTTLIKGQTYELTVQVGIVGDDTATSYYGDDIRVWVDWNGNRALLNNASERIVNLYDNGAAGTYTFTVPATAITGDVRMRVQVLYYDASDPTTPCGLTFTDGETEDYTLHIIDPCTPITSPFTFYPREGSRGTEIRISRTSGSGGFTNVDSVYINGIKSPSIRIIDDYTMFATVPDGAGTGMVTLYDNSPCHRNSSIDFTYLNKSGACGVYSDLFISEIYDTIGQLHYIEIYNGTNSAIDLTSPNNYSIQILNKSSYSDPSPTVNNINITGIIPAGENRVYYAGQTGPKVTGSQAASYNGFNAYDDVLLLKNGVVLDRYTAPTTTYFTYRRNNTATAPSTTYSSSDWTSAGGVTSSNIGIYVPLVPFTINTQPINSTGCAIDFDIDVTGSGLSYQWYYNDNLTNDVIWRVADSLSILFPLCTVTGATTDHLTVSGDLSLFDNYQFYCVVTKTTCSEYTKVARFRLQPDPYFRSKQSGNWKLASTWETSPSAAGPWSDACTYPWDSNSVYVHIINGHEIDIIEEIPVTPDVQIDQLVIENGGLLKLESNAELFVHDSSGTDIIVEGTLYDQGTSGANNGVSFLGSATWSLGANGTLIKTSNSSTTSYKDNYEGGISTIPATANWIFRRETNVVPSILTIDMFYPNLYFEDTYTGGTIYTFNGLSGYTTVKGSLFVGDTGLNVIVNNNNTNSTPMRVLGNVTVGSGSTYRIATTPGTGIEVGGNITNRGTFDINHLSSGILRMNGSGSQHIGGSGTFDIWDMELDKPSQTLVILDTFIDVTHQLNFSGGIIDATSYYINVVNGDPTNAITGFETPNNTGSYSDDNYVIGNLRRTINNANNIYTYPVGDAVTGMGYNPTRLVIRNVPGGSPYATGEFVPVWPGTINTFRTLYCGGELRFIEYRGLACDSYWHFEGSTFDNYDIFLHPNVKNLNLRPNENTSDGHLDNYRALKEHTDSAGKVWDPDVSVAGNPCIVSDTYYEIIGSGYSGFSIFAPGGGNGNTTALPIELLYFNLQCNRENPTLSWATASEKNTVEFTIEKSSDGINFKPIAHIPAAGNSHQKIEYSYSLNSFELDNYYRLVETDIDGSKYYHGIISNDCLDNFHQNVHIFFQEGSGIVTQMNPDKLPTAIQVYDASGRLMIHEAILQNNTHTITQAMNWAKGMYFVTLLYSNDEIYTEKVVIY